MAILDKFRLDPAANMGGKTVNFGSGGMALPQTKRPPGWEGTSAAAPTMATGQGVMKTPTNVPGMTGGPVDPLTGKSTRPAPFTTDRARTNAQANLDNLSMQDLQREANGGSLPPRFGEARPLLGNTTFRNLKPRGPAGSMGGASGAPMTGETEQSSAGFAPYLNEQTGGAPRRISGFRGRRPGARFTEGPMRGKTFDQALLKSRDQYAGLSPDQKAAYEGKARNQDISTPVPAAPAAKPMMPATPAAPAPVSIDGAELTSLRPPGQRPLRPTLPPPRGAVPMPTFPGGSRNPADDEQDY